MARASYAASSGRRLWAGAFDAISVAVIFLAVAAAAEGLGLDLSRWSVFALIYFLYNLICLVYRDGRTLGKTAVDICVVSAAGRRLTLAESITRAAARSWPLFLLDAKIAGVLDWYLSLPLTVLLGMLSLATLLIAETTLLGRSPTRQTIADRLAGSLVVTLPPMQPHRAPAIPMYSPTDAEFGRPPGRPADRDEGWRKRSNSAGVTDACAAALRASSAAQRGR